jgi:mRNA interferase MazF
MAMVNRFDVYLVNLDASPSADARNTRPCVVISPDELNANVHTVIIAPLSSRGAKLPTRVPVDFLNGERSIILDQIRTVDKVRLVKKIGEIDYDARKATIATLLELFAE